MKKRNLLFALLCVTGATACAAGLTACNGEHVHEWGDDWQHNAEEHWQVCTEDNEQSEHSAHAWERTEHVKEATCTEDGSEKLTCKVCGLTKTADISKLGHDLNWVYDCENHHRVCSRGDKTELEENHEFTKTTGANGLVTITCKCGYTATGEASGTVQSPLELTADKTSYSVILNPSEIFEGSDASYYTFTPKKNSTLTLTCADDSRGTFSVGYYKITEERGEEIKNYIASEVTAVTENGKTGVIAEVAAGVEYTVAVSTTSKAVQNLDFGVSLHEHEYASDWSSDGSTHWHASTCHADTAIRGDEAAHIFKNGLCTVCKQPMAGTECLIYGNENEETMTIKVSGVKSGETLPAAVVIPETVEKNGKTYTVTEIMGSSSLFNGNTQIESITLPNTIKTIASNAFKGCTNLKTLNIFDLDAYIAINFGDTTAVPFNAYAAGGEIYLNGELLENIDVEVESNLGAAFYNCASVKTVKISAKSGLEELLSCSYTFNKCVNLTSAEIGAGFSELGNSLFSGCTKLESFIIPEGITSLGSSTFTGCSLLKTIILPESITSLGSSCFMNCTALENVVILNNGATTVGSRCFNKCTNISNIYFNGTSEEWESIKEAWITTGRISTEPTVHYAGEWELVEGEPQLKAQA